MDNLKRLIIIPICLLTACAPPKPQALEQLTPGKVIPAEQLKEKKQTVKENGQATSVSSWEIRGAMAAKNKAKGWSAAMNWVQNGPGSYQIRLMGPLGAGTILISKSGNTITFQDGPKRITSSNADELLVKQTGIRLPVSNLYYWIRGLPAPGKVGGEQRDQSNHLVQLKQSGYNISFGNYTVVKGVALPGLIRLQGNGVMVKVVIKKWSF